VTNPSWGTKRNCPSCSAHFYDLNKTPAVCPKCKHQFDPSVAVRPRRKSSKRDSYKEDKVEITSTLMGKKTTPKKDKKQLDAEGAGEGIGDIAEMEDVDDIENLQELSELEEMEETPVNGDDADDEAVIDELDTDKALVGNVEEEEARALGKELEDDDGEPVSKKKPKPVAKPKKK
jgi:uncharacterized protein (TIGR02300 family)